MKKELLFFFAVSLIVLVLFSCETQKEEAKNISVSSSKITFKNITTKSSVTFEGISSKIAALPKFDFYKVKDPFYSPIAQASVKQTKTVAAFKNLKPTQKFELEKYKLVGVVVNKKAHTAIFEDPDGKGWVLKEGMYIGNEGFKIKKIIPDGVIVEEIITDSFGKHKSNERLISLKKIY